MVLQVEWRNVHEWLKMGYGSMLQIRRVPFATQNFHKLVVTSARTLLLLMKRPRSSL